MNSLTGLWWVSGSDAELGRYHGLLQIRAQIDGTLQAIRLVSLDEYRYHDGRHVDLVWTGRVESDTTQSARIFVALRRADFITEVGELKRTAADATPLEVIGEVQVRGNTLAIHYTAAENSNFSVTEKAHRLGPSGNKPIWQSERFERETHPDPELPFTPNPVLQFLLDTTFPGLVPQKGPLFQLFASYHALPAVQPFVSDPLFQRAVHLQIVDHTDFNYYRLTRNRLRIVNKVIDAISLAETEIRANAFRASFIEKERFYQAGLTQEFVGPHGMVVASIDALGQEKPDTDSALWTGVYTYTQALRYRHTGQQEALTNLRHSLKAILTLMDITGNPRTFARTLRLSAPVLEEEWHRGTGEFAHLDWREGGNNDMAKGLVLGMIAGWEVLPEGDPLREAIPGHALRLLQLDIFNPTDQSNQSSLNPAVALLLAGITNGDLCIIADRSCIAAGLVWLHNPQLTTLAQYGGGPFYLFGISDWSGNHLILTETLALQWLLSRTDDGELRALWIQAPARVWEVLRLLEYPLYAALAVPAYPSHTPERKQAIEEALWGLRSFPFPKHPYSVDHRLRDDFVLSPFPQLPWKLDWTTNPGRQQSIRAYPMLEQAVGAYRWNDGHFTPGDRGFGDHRVPGVDYLLLYWIARDKGLIPLFVQ